VEKFEEPKETLVREIKEELSLDINASIKASEFKYLCTLLGPSHDSARLVSLTLYQGNIDASLVQADNEIEQIDWFDMEENSIFAPLVNEFIKKVKEKKIKLILQ
jgi:8-oxo-dGTP pyrophosphatase MutT (NUDIX family)